MILVAGLPGCGQDLWAEKQCESIGPEAVLLSDPLKFDEEWDKVTENHQYVFVVDPYLCLMDPDTIQDRLEKGLKKSLAGVALRWACTENDLEFALQNTEPKHERLVRKLSRDFKVPAAVQIIPTKGRQSPWWTIPVYRVFPQIDAKNLMQSGGEHQTSPQKNTMAR